MQHQFRRWLLTPVPVRELAQSAGVGAMTVWRWRRRVLRELRTRRVCWCAGEVHLARLGWRVDPWRHLITGLDRDGRTLEFWFGIHGPLSSAEEILRRHIAPAAVLVFSGPAMCRLEEAARRAGFTVPRRGAHAPRSLAIARAQEIRRWVARFSVGPIRDPLGHCAWYDELHGRPQPPFPLPTPRWYSSPVSRS